MKKRTFGGRGDRVVAPVIETLEGRQLLSAELVRDINGQTYSSMTGYLSDGPAPVVFKGEAYFSANDGLSNVESLWKTDGTPGGTVKVEDATHEWSRWRSFNIAVAGDWLYFSRELSNGIELWKTDGSGTELVKTFSNDGLYPRMTAFTAVGDTLFFFAPDAEHGSELWKTDGTSAGTEMVKDIRPGAWGSLYLENLQDWQYPGYTWTAVMGGALYFVATGPDGTELWKSDGTEAGTTQVKDVWAGTGSSFPSSLTVMGGNLYFAATDAVAGFELWRSDGTEAGTWMVKDEFPGTNSRRRPAHFFALGDRLYYYHDNGFTGFELFGSDGTPEGTGLINDLDPGVRDSNNRTTSGPVYTSPHYAAMGGEVYFTAITLSEGVYIRGLWKTDGTGQGTVRVSGPTMNQALHLRAAAGKVYFRGRDSQGRVSLWQSDGTAEGTVVMADAGVGNESVSPSGPAAVLGDRLIWPGWSTAGGHEPYVTDLATGVSTRIIDLNAISGDSIRSTELAVLPGGRFVFAANAGLEYEKRPWVSDGTPGGTRQLKDVKVSEPAGGAVFRALDGEVYFSALGAEGEELWKTDGTPEGTVLVKDINPGAGSSKPRDFFDHDGLIYFQADHPSYGTETWRSDGTEEGTFLLKDIDPWTSFTPNTVARQWAVYGGRVYFAAPGSDSMVYSTDGTAAGTVPLGALKSTPLSMAATSAGLFMTRMVNGALELWKSDGSAAGTTKVPDSVPKVYVSGSLVSSGDVLYFLGHDGSGVPSDAQSNWALWRTDGTAAGTYAIEDLAEGESAYPTFDGRDVGGRLFFSAYGDLWKSDGSAAGTGVVRTPAGESIPSVRAVADGKAYVLRWDAASGTHELWKTDGSVGGTVLVAAGIEPASPESLTVVGEMVYFVGALPEVGKELFKIAPPAASLVARELVVKGEGGRVEVHAEAAGVVVISGGKAMRFGNGEFDRLVVSSGVVHVGTGVVVAALEIGGGATVRLMAGARVVVDQLEVGAGAVLDVRDGAVKVRTGDVQGMLAQVNAWVRCEGILSSNSREDLSGLTGLAVVPAGGGVEVKYTWGGDADGDGEVSADDYYRIDRGFLARRGNYHEGDFNYDGKIDLEDYGVIDAAYWGQSGVLG